MNKTGSKNRTDADGNKFNGLKPDPNDYHGKFGELSLAWELMQGEGLPGKCAADPDNVHHISNLQETSDDPRTKEAKECGVTGAFAVFRDGAVWEFVQEKPMDAAPTALVDTFGGSTGTAVMTAALAAIKLRSKMGKFSKKKATAGVTDKPKGTPDYDPMSAVSKS